MPTSRRSFLQTSAAVLCGATLAQAATGVIRRPYLQRLLENRVSILWTTAQPVSGWVAVTAPDGSVTTFAAAMRAFPPNVTQLSAPFYQYQADVTGLDAGVRYRYQVMAGGQLVSDDAELNNFRTPAAGDFSFLVFGDSGEATPEQSTLIRLMAAEGDISKVIHLGDLAYDSGTFAQLEANYFTLNAPLMSRLPFFTTPGNHEYRTGFAAPYLAGHVAPDCGVPAEHAGRYYSYDWGDAHFVALDSNLLYTEACDAMLAWLDADLRATRKYWKIVFMHHPAYPTGNHAGDAICGLVQEKLAPILEENGVQLALAGHEHGYERSFPLKAGKPGVSSQRSTTYVISGGGGASLHTVGTLPQCAKSIPVFNYLRVDVSGTALTFLGKGLDGTVFDRVTLTPPPVLTSGGVVSSGDYSQAVAPGSLVSIFGNNLAPRPAAATAFPLAAELGGISVRVNGAPAPVLYASPSQLNVQLPFEASGRVTLQVDTPNGSASTQLTVAPTAPSILAVVSRDKLNSELNPAPQGSFVTVYMTGLGATATQVGAGQRAGGPVRVTATVEILLGDVALPPLYAGLAPGFAGLNQVNFQVPVSMRPGVYPLRVSAGGVASGPAAVDVGLLSKANAPLSSMLNLVHDR